MNGFVYFLKSNKRNNWVYVGSTNNLDKRIKEHNKGQVPATKGFRPLELLYREIYPNIALARQREHFLKGWQGRKIKKNIINDSRVACLRRQV